MAGEESLMGNLGQHLSTIGVGLNVDVNPINKLSQAFGDLNKKLKDIEKQMKAVEKQANKTTKALSSASTAPNNINMATDSSIGDTKVVGRLNKTEAGGSNTFSKMRQMFDSAKKLGTTEVEGMIVPTAKAMGIAAGVSTAAAAVKAGLTAIDNRVDSARDYALSADRMSVLYQQMTGKTQNQVANQYRQPLTNYRLGEGGINTLLGLQARTGINAAQQAGSVEALRTYSGYSLGAGDAANVLANLGSAPVANRMFLMAGGGLVGVGGKQNSMQSVMQNIVRTSGLTDERLAKTAIQQGSISRARLTEMGVSGDLQDQVIQYAQQNVQFKKKGGVGMYDASKKADRKLMGIEDNFATQAEETDRVRGQRDEQFYKRQADNYADLEKQTQKLVKVFGALEDKLSGIIGARTSNRISSTIGGGIGGALGGALGLLFGPAGAAIGGGLGYMAGTAIGGALGDPDLPVSEGPSSSGPASSGPSGAATSDDSLVVPTDGGDKKLSDVKNSASFKGMNQKMQERVLNLIRANPRIGFGQGFRSQEQQKAMFLDRYRRTDKPTKTKWDGSYWEHVKGPAAMPPGYSMHGLGLAADLVIPKSELSWVKENASKFGLKEFSGGTINEPWHVQPAELPDGAEEYLKNGAAWGTSDGGPTPSSGAPTPSIPSDFSTDAVSEDGGKSSSASSSTRGSVTSLTHRTIAEALADKALGSGGGGGGGSSILSSTSSVSPASPTSATSIGNTNVTVSTDSNSEKGALPVDQVAAAFAKAGFRGEDLVKMIAISGRESRWVPTALRTDNKGQNVTGDFGLLQINYSNFKLLQQKMGIKAMTDLFDPNLNAQAAKILFDAGHGSYTPWKASKDKGWDANGSELYGTDNYLSAAKVAAKKYDKGDPPIPTASAPTSSSYSNDSSGGAAITMQSGHTFHINVPVTVTRGTDTDIQALASKVAKVIKRELAITDLRST